jgi:hypothetical protein
MGRGLEGGGFELPVPRQRRHPSATANHLSEPRRPVFKIELKPRRSAMTLSLPANRCTGHVILGLDRLTRHAAQMDREPELKIIWRAFTRRFSRSWSALRGGDGDRIRWRARRLCYGEFCADAACPRGARRWHANRVRTRRRHPCQCRRDAARASRPGDDLRSWGFDHPAAS